MNVYEIEFMEYTNAMRNTVHSKKHKKYIDVNREGFIARESDLDYLKEFGKGFRKLRFLGELYQGNLGSLVINVSCNLVGVSDAEKAIQELQQKLSDIKFDIRI